MDRKKTYNAFKNMIFLWVSPTIKNTPEGIKYFKIISGLKSQTKNWYKYYEFQNEIKKTHLTDIFKKERKIVL